MIKFISKVRFFLNKPQIVIIPSHLKLSRDLILFLVDEIDLYSGGKIPNKKILLIDHYDSFLIKNSSFSILVAQEGTDLSRIDNFNQIIVDKEALREVGESKTMIESIGTEDRFSFWASDIDKENGTTFKVNYGGDCIPFWINKNLSDDELIEVIFALKVATSLGVNLVESSQKLKEFDLQIL